MIGFQIILSPKDTISIQGNLYEVVTNNSEAPQKTQEELADNCKSGSLVTKNQVPPMLAEREKSGNFKALCL